jgi:hypothetical protein
MSPLFFHFFPFSKVNQPVAAPDPTQLFSLNCFVLGDDPSKVFTVKILKTENVSILKDLIKEKQSRRLNHVDASDLILSQVSLPVDDDLEKSLKNIDLAPLESLLPLSQVFPHIEANRLHIVVQAPTTGAVALHSMQLLSLNCFILGDDPDRMFTVKIPKTENVSILKKLIKEENPSSLGNIDVKNIDLWQASLPIDDLPSKNPPTLGPKLRSEKLLSDAFPSELDINHIHIVARPPGQGEHDIDSALMLFIIPSRRTLS